MLESSLEAQHRLKQLNVTRLVQPDNLETYLGDLDPKVGPARASEEGRRVGAGMASTGPLQLPRLAGAQLSLVLPLARALTR